MPPSITPDEDIEDFVHRAMDERLDLHAARRQIRLAELDLDSVWMSFTPSLDLTWSLSHTLTDLGGFGDRRTSWNLVVALSVPLLTGGLRVGQIRDRRARIRQAELAEEALRRSAATEVRRSYRSWRTAMATLAISQRQLELARETNRLVRASFAAGAATSLDLVDSQRMLAAAEIDVEIRRLSSQLALIELLSRQEVGAQTVAGTMGSSASGAP
jgi:outer membrane protein TolC